jgi:hypothetical protein
MFNVRPMTGSAGMTDAGEQAVDGWILDLLEDCFGQKKSTTSIAIDLGLPVATAERALQRLQQSGRVRLLGRDPDMWSIAV